MTDLAEPTQQMDQDILMQQDVMQAPSDEALRSVAALAASQVQLEEEIENAETIIQQMKEDHRKVSEELLPAALREHGLSGFTMHNGNKVTVSKYLHASIAADWPFEKRQRAFGWLRDNGFGDLIRHVVKASFQKGEEEQAKALVEEISRLGCKASDLEDVHWATLTSFVREQTEQGNAVPDDLLGVYRGEIAKIERAR